MRHQRELASIVESSHDAIIGKRLDGVITSWNRAAVETYGYTAEEAIGRSVEILEPPERAGEMAGFLERLRAGQRLVGIETVRIAKDGTRLNVRVTISPIEDGGKVVGASSIARDLTPLLEAAAAVRRSEETYRQLFDRHPAPMFVYARPSLRLVAVNDAMVESYGWSREELLAMTVEQLWPPEDVEEILNRIHEAPQDVRHSRMRHRRADGSTFAVDVTARTIDYQGTEARLVLAHDLTEQERLEQELRQTQKMDAIGRLAGGIAHDFNNLLVVIRGNTHLLLGKLEGEAREFAEQIDAAAERASGLTRQLLAFSRQRVLHLEPLDVNEIVASTVELLRRSIGAGIVIEETLAPGLGAITADRSELVNTLLNLAINARDAMPDGGTLQIRTAAVDVGKDQRRGELPPGHYVLLQVTDTGIGMDEDTRTQAFDPFFTTKGDGTGLGLAAVYGAVRQSGGHIWLYSEVGVGTTFKLYFPVTADVPATSAAEAEVATVGGSETILVVEDTELVRGLVASTLESYGYEVIAVANAEDALAICEERLSEIDLVLTDVIMPGMNGRELAERLLAVRPALKVLFTSGYPADTVLRLGIADSVAHFIEKPYLPDELARKVRVVLGEEGS